MPNTYLIRREQLASDPTQHRKIFDEIELAASIQSRGIKQPLTVRWDITTSKYMVIDGGGRYLAAERLGFDKLPCWIQEDDSKDVLIDQIVHNWQRANPRPKETADALTRLRDDFNLSQKQIATFTGKPASEISKLLAIRDRIVPEVQQLASEQTKSSTPLTMRHLYNISKLPANKQSAITKQVRDSKFTATETEQLLAQTQNRTHHKPTGLQTRQRRFHTPIADVLITFNKPI